MRLAVVGVLGVAASVVGGVAVGPVGAVPKPALDQPTAVEAGDALAAATSVETAKAALLTIFANGGIAVADGTGAPADQAVLQVPTWFVDALAGEQVDGGNVTVTDNARIFDTMLRWAGASAVTPATFSGFLSDWFQNPADPQEAYVLGAIAELGKQTVPPVDYAAGAAADAPLPWLLLLEEEIELGSTPAASAATDTSTPATSAGFRANGFAAADGVGFTRRAPAPTPCELLNMAKSAADNAGKTGKFIEDLVKWIDVFREGGLPAVDHALGDVGAAGEAGAGAAAAAAGTVVAAMKALLQTGLAHEFLMPVFSQDPDPVIKHEPGNEPNQAKLTVTVSMSDATPKDFFDCLKAIPGLGDIGIDLGAPGKPLAKAIVNMNAGANFDQHLTFNYSHTPDSYATVGQPTDSQGRASWMVDTKPQKLPAGVGKDATRDVGIKVVVKTQKPGFSVSAFLAALFDGLDPWTGNFTARVTQRETEARTISGSFNLDAAFVGVQGTLHIYSCNGFDGPFTGTVSLSGGLENGFDQIATQLTGLPATASGVPAINAALPARPKNPSEENATSKPVLNTVTSIAGKLGIKFIDDHTAELTADGTALFSIQTGKVFTFAVTEGATECPNS
ncbi:MAG: hypothetical protein JWL72_3398 [Ilumatobacteraceae bacterium]|nr:hypothetical protein [Ilumatobacteraceae bacterium]